MNPETTIAELLRLWPRLPDLAGARWPAMYWQLVDLLRAFCRATADQQRAGVAIGVQRWLASVPEVRAAWAAEDAVLVRGGNAAARECADPALAFRVSRRRPPRFARQVASVSGKRHAARS